MANKTEIGWTRRSPEGETFELYARRAGKQWSFYIRQRRYEQWQALEHPPLEDWLKLLDAVRRRVDRRLLRPEEIDRVKQSIRESFPEAEV